MAVKQVILINVGAFQYRAHPYNYQAEHSPHLGNQVIKNGLRQNGFTNTCFYPTTSFHRPDIQQNSEEISFYLQRLGMTEPNTVVGLSLNSADYFKLEALISLLKSINPSLTIVAGGPHFVRENLSGVCDPVEDVLAKSWVDAVVVGHAQPFIDLITKFNGNLDAADSPGFFRWDTQTKTVVGSGIGAFPALNDLPYTLDEYGTLGLMLRNDCFNRCGFCSINMSGPVLADEVKIMSDLFLLLSDPKVQSLNLYDPNIFGPGTVDFYSRIFKQLMMLGIRKDIGSFCLSPAIVNNMWGDSETFGALGDFAATAFQMPILSVYLGRDAVRADDAENIGKKLLAKPIEQGKLDRLSSLGIQLLINLLKGLSIGRVLAISNMISPLQTPDSLAEMLGEINYFLSQADGSLEIVTPLASLIPAPGTPARHNLLKYIKDPNDYSALTDLANPWSAEIGELYPFLQKFIELRRVFSGTEGQFMVQLEKEGRLLYGAKFRPFSSSRTPRYLDRAFLDYLRATNRL